MVVSFVGWQGALFSCGHGNDTGEAFGCSRPLSGSRTATTGIGRVAGFGSAGRPVGVGRYIGFAVVMAQVRRPVPFRTRKLRPGRGDGTALERVWESSTPPHSTLDLLVESLMGFPEGLFFYSHRVFSSGRWGIMDVGKPVRGRIPPVGGGFRTVEGLWTYWLFQ